VINPRLRDRLFSVIDATKEEHPEIISLRAPERSIPRGFTRFGLNFYMYFRPVLPSLRLTFKPFRASWMVFELLIRELMSEDSAFFCSFPPEVCR
jgi:hypothetical protein